MQSKRIDLMPISEQHYIELQEKGEELEAQVRLLRTEVCHRLQREFSPRDLLGSRMQGALDKLIADGTQAEIFDTYNLRYSNFGLVAANP